MLYNQTLILPLKLYKLIISIMNEFIYHFDSEIV